MAPDGIWGIEIFVRRSGSFVRVDEEIAMPYPFSLEEQMNELFQSITNYCGFSSRVFNIQSAIEK
jgi:hypothetical protein